MPGAADAVRRRATGSAALLVTPAVLGALAVLTFAGLVARLAGARWAPLAALAFAVCLPILYTSRTTFSEIPSLILLFGGADPGPRRPARRRGSQRWERALAGLVFGLAVLVRVDGLRDVLPVLAFAGSADRAAARLARAALGPRARRGCGLLVGLVAGVGLGLLAAQCWLGRTWIPVPVGRPAAADLRRRAAAHAGRYGRRAAAWPGVPAAALAARRRGPSLVVAGDGRGWPYGRGCRPCAGSRPRRRTGSPRTSSSRSRRPTACRSTAPACTSRTRCTG